MNETITKLRLNLENKPSKKMAWEIIREYFMGWQFEDCEGEIDELLLGALTSDQIESSEKGRDRFNMILFCEYTKLFIKAVELLHKKKQAKNTTT